MMSEGDRMMWTRTFVFRLLIGLTSTIPPGVYVVAAEDPPELTAAQRRQLEQEAEQIRQSLQTLNRSPDDSKHGLPVGIVETHIRLGIIQGLLGDANEERRCFFTAWDWERRYTKEILSNQPGGEDAFAPSRLEKRWAARDAALSISDSTLGLYGQDIYERVWETKGYSTRLLQRAYAAMRRVALMEAKSDLLSNHHFAALRARMDVRRQIVRLLLEPTRDPASRDRRLAELVKVKTRLMNENIDLLAPTWTPDETKVVHRAVPLELRRHLGNSRIFIDFLRYPRLELDPARAGGRYVSTYVAFILPGLGIKSKTVSHRNVSRVDLGPCDPIDAAIASWRMAIERGEDDANSTAIVNRLVWQPIAKGLPPGITTVYLSPDGQLGMLPWAALPGQRPGHVYLLEDYALRRSPTVVFSSWSSSVLALRPNTKRSANECVETPATRSWASDI